MSSGDAPMPLAAFLLARIAEDEECATTRPPNGMKVEISVPAPDGNGYVYREIQEINPRVLAECEAKRRIIEEHPCLDGDWCRRCVYDNADDENYPCATLRALALPYTDHPDYREEWRL